MSSFDALSYAEQVECLTQAAHAALAQWGIQPRAVQLLAYLNNAVFRVDTLGRAYVLRLGRPAAGRAAWLGSEIVWLEHLNTVGLIAPPPLRPLNGEAFGVVPVEGMETPFLAALFGWLDGDFATLETLTTAQAEQAGYFLACLHTRASQFVAPSGFTRPRLDWEGLFGQNSPYNEGANASIYTPDQRAIFDATAAHVRESMAQPTSDRQAFGLIHGDYVMKNILFRSGAACAIDYDDCAWGHYLYDLAPLLLQLTDSPSKDTLRAAYLRGYAALRPLPPDELTRLETFIAARHLLSCRWVARNLHNPRIRERAPAILAGRAAQLRRFLDTGRMDSRGEEF